MAELEKLKNSFRDTNTELIRLNCDLLGVYAEERCDTRGTFGNR